MKTFDLNTGNKLNNESSMNHFFKEALTIEELFSVRGGNSDDPSSSDDEKKNGSDDDQQEDALL